MPRISSPRPLDLTKPFLTSSQAYGSVPFNLSENLVTWYRDIQGDFVPDLSGNGNTARCAGSGSFLPVVTSIDSPEFNYSRFDIRSFSFEGGSSGIEYPHIKTVSSTNAPFASDDHSFTDGTKDLPFSVSFWIKPQATSAQQYIISKINSAAAFSGYEWSIEMDGKILRTILNGTGAASKYLQWQRAGTISAGEWSHIVATYNGSEDITGIKMYLNGSLISPSSLTFNAYTGMSKTSTPICIGNKFNSTAFAAVSSEEYDGLIHSVAIWKNRALNATEINALHKAYVNGPGGEARSGFISRPPRLLIRELDDLPGSYPTVRRTGDPTRTGALTSNFNDGTSIVFSQSGNVVFPTMLPKGSSFASQAVDIIGQESDISASLPIRSFQQPAHLHYSPTESVGPFNENRAMPATAFFLNGTDPDILPGFTSPVRSKIAIEIDITPQSDTMLMRNVSRRNTAEGAPVGTDNTGFLYYNFANREWDQVGAKDPSNGNPIYYDFSYTGGTQALSTGSFPCQFSYTPGYAAVGSSSLPDVMNVTGYQKIGTPTATMGAPELPKYHARDPQSLKLSDYINAPFLLEKVSVSFEEVNVQRVNGRTPPAPTGIQPHDFKSGSIRDIDNYVFFLYRQSRSNREKDTVFDVSSSVRHLIASASMTFWNSPSLSGSGLTHGPAFEHNFNLPLNDSYAVGSFTGSLSLNFQPAVCGPQFLNVSVLPDDDGISTNSIINSWPGSTSIQNYPSDFSIFDFGLFLPSIVLDDESLGSFASRLSRLDPRATRKFGGETASPTEDSFFGVRISAGTPQSNPSPYLLLPSDELVVGLEAGVGPAYRAGNFSHITGSFMRVLNKRCTVTLHGSMVKDGVEHLPSLNQDLSSNSIHEIIGAEPVLDQFQIEPRSSYYGSYLDEIVTGSMAILNPDGTTFTIYDQDNSRRVIGRTSA